METWEVVVLILMGVFGLGMPLWAGHMLKNAPDKSQPTANEATIKAVDEAKNKLVSGVVEANVDVAVEAPAEKTVPQAEATEQPSGQ
ncbi:MAG: hypothetical protein G01um101413_442 [Parcubacteria group bacterium Gr01-1014_13]|nr:MAG: hypothetical protein G01um101413_442 [Parcubacteria group bacterium Gr01-1014_13]